MRDGVGSVSQSVQHLLTGQCIGLLNSFRTLPCRKGSHDSCYIYPGALETGLS